MVFKSHRVVCQLDMFQPVRGGTSNLDKYDRLVLSYSQSSFAVGFIGQQHLTHMNKHGQHADRSTVTDVTCKVVIDPFCGCGTVLALAQNDRN